MNKFYCTVICLVATLVGACDERKETQKPLSHTVYPAIGVVQELVPDDRGVFIDHEEIPGFMVAMTMYLKVAEQEDYQSLKVGHQYTFELLVDGGGETRVQNLVPTGKVVVAGDNDTSPSESWFKTPDFELGDSAPDFLCISSKGEEISPAVLKGKAWAITFIFTRCPLPDYCPRMTLRFKEAVDLLEERGVDGWKMISLTIDPKHDQLDVLQSYRDAWGISSDDWHFCRAEPEQVREIGDPLGLAFQSSEFPIEHNLRTAVFDSEGRLVEVFSGNGWTSLELADSIINAMK